MTGWVDGMGGLLEGRKSSLLENKEAKKTSSIAVYADSSPNG
jgi:hypothetical protein